jgi:hypothetical protein
VPSVGRRHRRVLCRRPQLALGKGQSTGLNPGQHLCRELAVNGYFFLADGPLWALGTGCAESLELGYSAKSRGREKILCEACAERDRRQSCCRRFIGLCREFAALGKGWISSSGCMPTSFGSSILDLAMFILSKPMSCILFNHDQKLVANIQTKQ